MSCMMSFCGHWSVFLLADKHAASRSEQRHSGSRVTDELLTDFPPGWRAPDTAENASAWWLNPWTKLWVSAWFDTEGQVWDRSKRMCLRNSSPRARQTLLWDLKVSESELWDICVIFQTAADSFKSKLKQREARLDAAKRQMFFLLSVLSVKFTEDMQNKEISNVERTNIFLTLLYNNSHLYSNFKTELMVCSYCPWENNAKSHVWGCRVDRIFTLSQIIKGTWEFSILVCILNLGKSFQVHSCSRIMRFIADKAATMWDTAMDSF